MLCGAGTFVAWLQVRPDRRYGGELGGLAIPGRGGVDRGQCPGAAHRRRLDRRGGRRHRRPCGPAGTAGSAAGGVPAGGGRAVARAWRLHCGGRLVGPAAPLLPLPLPPLPAKAAEASRILSPSWIILLLLLIAGGSGRLLPDSTIGLFVATGGQPGARLWLHSIRRSTRRPEGTATGPGLGLPPSRAAQARRRPGSSMGCPLSRGLLIARGVYGPAWVRAVRRPRPFASTARGAMDGAQAAHLSCHRHSPAGQPPMARTAVLRPHPAMDARWASQTLNDAARPSDKGAIIGLKTALPIVDQSAGGPAIRVDQHAARLE